MEQQQLASVLVLRLKLLLLCHKLVLKGLILNIVDFNDLAYGWVYAAKDVPHAPPEHRLGSVGVHQDGVGEVMGYVRIPRVQDVFSLINLGELIMIVIRLDFS